jgi:hypothetical protein
MTLKCKSADEGIRKIANFEHFCYLGDNAPQHIWGGGRNAASVASLKPSLRRPLCT